MSSPKIIAVALLVAVIVLMESKSAMGRPQPESDEAVTSAKNMAKHGRAIGDRKSREAYAESDSNVVNQLESKVIRAASDPNAISPEVPSLIVREKRWDGCGYKGMC